MKISKVRTRRARKRKSRIDIEMERSDHGNKHDKKVREGEEGRGAQKRQIYKNTEQKQTYYGLLVHDLGVIS